MVDRIGKREYYSNILRGGVYLPKVGGLVPACRQAGLAKYMYYVYVLASRAKGQLYIGMTNNVGRRLSEHNGGFVKSTKGFRPFRLIGRRSFGTREEARAFEVKLKSGACREYINKQRGVEQSGSSRGS